jgi:hypothetical protein
MAAEVVGSDLRKLLGEPLTLLQGDSGFFKVAFDPMEGALGSPVIGVEACRFFGLHAVSPEACGLGIAANECISENKRGVKLRRDVVR